MRTLAQLFPRPRVDSPRLEAAGLPGALALFFHRRFVSRDVDAHAALRGHLGREIEREPERVVELERDGPGKHLLLTFLERRRGLLEAGDTLLQRFGEAG